MSHIQNRHDNLDVEILNEAKSTNIESLQQKVEFQKKLKTILDKRQIEEEKNSSNYNSIESDALYQVLKTDDKQDLLQKLSDRTMTQEEYIQLSEEYNVNQDVVEYEIEGSAEEMSNILQAQYDKMDDSNKPYLRDLEKLQLWKGLKYREEAGKKIIDVPGFGEICSTMKSGIEYRDMDDKNGKRSLDNLKHSDKFKAFALTIKNCEMMELSDTYKLMNLVAKQLGITDTIDENYINILFKKHKDENLPLENPFGRVLRALYMMTGECFVIPISVDGKTVRSVDCYHYYAGVYDSFLDVSNDVRPFAKIGGSLS